jgi:hypothetical protein
LVVVEAQMVVAAAVVVAVLHRKSFQLLQLPILSAQVALLGLEARAKTQLQVLPIMY